jgi:hypothetical protein
MPDMQINIMPCRVAFGSPGTKPFEEQLAEPAETYRYPLDFSDVTSLVLTTIPEEGLLLIETFSGDTRNHCYAVRPGIPVDQPLKGVGGIAP